MGEFYRQVEEEFARLRQAVEQTSGVDLSDIRLMPTEEYLELATYHPVFGEVQKQVVAQSPMLFSPGEAVVVANEGLLEAEQRKQKGFDPRFYLVHELSHSLQWAMGDFTIEPEMEQSDTRYAEMRKDFCDAPQRSERRKELRPLLEARLKDIGRRAKVLNTLKEGFAVYYQLEGMDLGSIDSRLAEYSRTMADALRIHAASGEDPLQMLLPGWDGVYSKGYDFFRRIVQLAEGDQSVLQDIIRCSPTTMDEIENPQLYWERTLKPFRDSRSAA